MSPNLVPTVRPNVVAAPLSAELTSADTTPRQQGPATATSDDTADANEPPPIGDEPLADLSQRLRAEVAAGKAARWIVLVEVCSPGLTEPRERRAFVYPPRVTFGRGEDCDIRLGPEERMVSSLHAELVRSDFGYLLRDAGSRNGLYLQNHDRPPGASVSSLNSEADSVATPPPRVAEVALEVSAQPTEILLGPQGPICRIRIGDVIPFADYLVTGRLGEGGMATVFIAQETTGLSRLVVLKLIAPSLLMSIDQKDAEAMLQEEARIASQISHPNVVNIFRAGCYQGSHYIAMEYLRGVNLGSIQRQLAKRRRRCPVDLAAALVSQALLGLHAAHEATDAGGRSLGIVHRDFTPTNIVCSPDGDVKLIDFGVARAIGRCYLSATGQFVGKPAYASPEQIQRPKTLDRRSDVFAAGIILYELCTGTPLFLRDHDFATMAAVIGDPVPSLAGIPETLAKIIASTLSRDPDGRPATAEALAEQLEQFVLAEGGGFLQRKRLAQRLRSLGVNLLAPTPCTLVGRPTLFPKPKAAPRISQPPRAPAGAVDALRDTPAVRAAELVTRKEAPKAAELPTRIALGGIEYGLRHCLQRSRPGVLPEHAIYAVHKAAGVAAAAAGVAGGDVIAANSELPLQLHLIGSGQGTAPLVTASLDRLLNRVSKWRSRDPVGSPFGPLIAAATAWPAGPFALLVPTYPHESSLQALLLHPALSWSMRCAVAYRLALAVAELAAEPLRMVHGELTPAQVVVVNESAPRVWLRLPLQLAGLLGEPASAAPLQVGADAALAWVGSSTSYGAPECLAGVAPTPRSDVFSLAAMIFELLGGDVERAAQAVHTGGRLPPLPPSAAVTPALHEALCAALHADPTGRPIAGELARCLATCVDAAAPRLDTADKTLRELLVPAPGSSVTVDLAAGSRLHLYSLRIDRLTNKGPLLLPLCRVSGLLPAPVSVSLFRDTLTIELAGDGEPGQPRARLYPDGAQSGTARLFLAADGSAFELGSRTQNRLQRFEYQALTDAAQDTTELPPLALRLRLPRPLRAALLWTRDLRSGDLHVCCAQFVE